MKLHSLIALAVLTTSTIAFAEIKGIFTRSQIATPPVAVSMGSQDGYTETEARLKVKETAEHYAQMMTVYTSKDKDNYPFSDILKSVNEICRDSMKLQLEGEKITYDLYTSLVDGNTYVVGILSFKYKCPELLRP